MKSFKDFIPLTGEKAFPFVYMVKSVSGVIERMKLAKTRCAVFREDLLCFFYALPVYREAMTDVITTEQLQPPVVFVIKPTCVDIKRIYPFNTVMYEKYTNSSDTGTGDSLLYKYNLISDYEMTPASLAAIQHYVKQVCDSNRNYFLGMFKSIDEFEVKLRENYTFRVMLEMASSNDPDYGTRTVEIQTACDLSFTKCNILAIIAPSDYCNMPGFMDMLKTTEAEAIFYNIEPGNFTDYISVIYGKIKKYYENFGYMEKES